MGGDCRYDCSVDLSQKNNSHTQLVLLAGEDKSVLEVGPATGYVSKALRERGCRVTGLELEAEAAAIASEFCERMIVGNIEEIDLDETFGDEKFDVIMFGDVLEHLVDPTAVLVKVARFLSPGGCVLASIPNVAHASVVLNLLAGEFRYTDLGLLDKTHLRFFTRESIDDMFREAGYRITARRRVTLDTFATEVPLRPEDYPAHIVEALNQGPESKTYQHIVKALPLKKAPSAPRHRSDNGAHASQRAEPVVESLWSTQERIHELEAAKQQLEQKEAEIRQVRTQLKEQKAENARLESVIAGLEAARAALIAEIQSIQSTVGYRTLERVRKVIRPPLRLIAPRGTRRRRMLMSARTAVNAGLARGGRRTVRKLVRPWEWQQTVRELSRGSILDIDVDERYRSWRELTAVPESKVREIKTAAANLRYRPMISIIVPVYNPQPNWLRDAVESVRAQYYDNWQLCLADDASTKPGVRELLADYERDPRIDVVYQPKNKGISAASNAALALAKGEYIALLDHDDELSPDALYHVVKLLNDRGERDFIYSDEDKRDASGALVSPFFKPDWSPDLEHSSNYVTHFSVYRREAVEKAGGFRSEFDGSQDYDLALRVTERTDKIDHIRRVLYTWRMVPGSAAASSEAKPYAYEAAKKALKESLDRRGIDAWVEDGKTMGWYRIRYRIPGEPLVSVLIPTRDRADLLAKCLDSLEASAYKRLEVIVVDNGSVEEATKKLLASRDLKVVRDAGDFNFSRLINAGAAAATGDYLLLLNNDVEAINDDWVEALVEHAQRPEVGVVGARLLYPNGRPQHEGVALGIGGTFAGHIDWRNYLGLSHAVRNCSAVTAAAALTRRSVFDELGGFDEAFRVAYGDVDYCLRARERGYLVVYTPYATLYHYESATRGSNHPAEDEKLARKRWGRLTDPYYNYAFDEVLQPWVYAPGYEAAEASRA